MKGYKAFDVNLKCHDFQYEIGQTYEMDGDIECCARGFHFCKELVNCYRFYEMSDNTRICKVEAIGEIKTCDDIKYCTNKIKILSEVKNPKIKSNTNTSSSGYCNSGSYNSGNNNNGDYNSGSFNTGNHNSGNNNSGNKNNGDFNSGYLNTGCNNTGDRNSGNHNSGYCNNGYCNSGDCNSGSFNVGDFNSGSHNSGDWNKGNYNIGVFNCDKDQKIKMFDKESDWTIKDWRYSRAYIVMLGCPYSEHEQEKIIFQESTEEDKKQKWWDELSEEDKNAVKSLPNFDADKFYICTGIRV